jgi:DNA-binding response OmpR family regulator
VTAESKEALVAFLQTVLEHAGFSTEWIGDGVKALSAVDSFHPDLILLNLALPGMDGLQICQAIRARQEYIPIIMLTARAADVDKIAGLEVGADDYVTKWMCVLTTSSLACPRPGRWPAPRLPSALMGHLPTPGH